MARARSGAPVLVTGMPRSGTTWLARLLATAPGTALAGREPMNPRGRQFGLGGTLTAWTTLERPTRRQRVALWTSYHGLNPLVYSRYGRRQAAAPLPTTRLIVKDPFALLSLPTVVAQTGATAVVLYRHPAAALASYRRMGWSPDLDELRPLIAERNARLAPGEEPVTELPAPGSGDLVTETGCFWAALYDIALLDARRLGDSVVVLDHAELAAGGAPAGRRLMERLGLTWNAEAEAELTGTTGRASAAVLNPDAEPGAASTPAPATAQTPAASPERLHNFDRAPKEVAESWRKHVPADEVARIEACTQATRARLEEARLHVG